MKAVRLFAWVALALVVFAVSLRFFNTPENKPQSGRELVDASAGPGGPFTLTSHQDKRVSDSDFRGKYMLVYFGYSYCPDVCRIELHKLSTAFSILEKEGYDLTPLAPIFITVDPERDTVAELADYMLDFYPGFIALTGTPEEISNVAKEYKIYYKKREQEGIDGYLMDHQSYVFVMDPDGAFNRIFSSRDTPQDIADALKPVLEMKS